MDSGLAATIEAVNPAPCAAVVAELLVARDRLEAKVCEALVGFVARGGHRVDGWGSTAGWLRAHGVGERDAQRLAVRVSRLAAWPELARLWFTGELSGAQIDLTVGMIPKGLVELFADHDTEISPLLVGLSAADTKRAVQHWVTRAEAVVAGGAVDADGPGSTAHLSRTLDGRAILDATLDPDTAAVTETALRIAGADDPDPAGGFRTAAERRGDALGQVMRFFCDHAATPGDRPGRQHPHVAVTIDPADMIAGSLRGLGIQTAKDLERLLAARPVSIFEEGLYRDALAHHPGTPVDHDHHPLTAGSLARLFTEGTLLHRLLIVDGQLIDRGRTLRLASPNLRDAMLVRDRGCRFPHCDAPTAWVHAHHLTHWNHGGETDLANLAGLCATHHGVVHRHEWDLHLQPDGTLVFTRPDATVLTSPPPRHHPPPVPPLHHPHTHGLIPTFPHHPMADPHPSGTGTDTGTDAGTETGSRSSQPQSTGIEPNDIETARRVRTRAVDLVRRHRRCPTPAPDLLEWLEAG